MKYYNLSTTQLRIIDCLFLLGETIEINNVTMEMVAKKAGIRRQNIYKSHFGSIDSIIHTAYNEIDKDIYEKLYKYINSKEDINIVHFISEELLSLFYEKRKWLRVIFNDSLYGDWKKYMAKRYVPIMREYIETKSCSHEFLDSCPELYTKDFLAYILFHKVNIIIYLWIKQENPLPPSIFSLEFEKLLSFSVNDILDIS